MALFSCADADHTEVSPEQEQIANATESATGLSDVVTFTRQMPGLDQDVEFIRGQAGGHAFKYVRLLDGTRITHGELMKRERIAREFRFGALSPELHAYLQTAEVSERIPVRLTYDANALLRAIETATSPTERAQRRANFRAQLPTLAANLISEMQPLGLQNISASGSMPVIYGTATKSELERMARSLSVQQISTAVAGQGVLLGATNGTTHPGIDAVNTTDNVYATGQSIGFVEVHDCGIRDTHESFDNSPSAGGANYQMSPKTCSSDTDCESCLAGTGVPPSWGMHRCVNNQCQFEHVFQTATVAVASRGGDPWHAANSELYVANEGVPAPGGTTPQIICSPAGLDNAYGFLADSGVLTVNESFGCFSDPTGMVEGATQDFFARNEDMLITKAAGNSADDVLACEWTSNSVCVGGSDAAYNWASWSSFRNPTESDREEPDIVALAEDVIVGDPDDDNAYVAASGTSFAAPSVAGFAAMLREACGGSHRVIHSIIRNSAWVFNPTGYRYSTPIPGMDQMDGAGQLYGSGMMYCGGDPGPGGGPSDIGLIDEPFDMSTSGEPPPGLEELEPGEPPMDAFGFGGAPRVGHSIWEGELPVGGRIRFTVVWDSCPAGTSGGGTGAPVPLTDLDLAIYNVDTEEWVYASQSFDDTVEGFDISIAESGVHQVWLLHEDGASGCTGPSEPIGGAWAAWW